MAWRLAKSLIQLRDQINATYSNRSKASDGAIGDAAHFAEGSASDHNPWLPGEVVSAIDVTHDPQNGLDIAELAQLLISSRDPRIKYIIRNAEIVIPSSSTGWSWRPYYGINSHSSHMHISVNVNNFDDPTIWDIGEQEITMTPYALNLLAQIGWNRPVNSSDKFVADYTGKDIEATLEDVLKSKENIMLRTKAANYDKQIEVRDAQIATLKKQTLPTSVSEYEEVTEKLYRKK